MFQRVELRLYKFMSMTLLHAGAVPARTATAAESLRAAALLPCVLWGARRVRVHVASLFMLHFSRIEREIQYTRGRATMFISSAFPTRRTRMCSAHPTMYKVQRTSYNVGVGRY